MCSSAFLHMYSRSAVTIQTKLFVSLSEDETVIAGFHIPKLLTKVSVGTVLSSSALTD
jgi:hypothetical protein